MIICFSMMTAFNASAYAENDSTIQDSITNEAVSLEKSEKWNDIIDAIAYIESRHDPNARCGNSVGLLQITPLLVSECNNILKRRKSKKRFSLRDRLSVSKSKEMFNLIQSVYNPTKSLEKACKVWGCGPFSKKTNFVYIKKIKQYLSRH